MNSKKATDIIKINNGVKDPTIDEVAVEKLLHIYINKEYYASLMCTPNEKVELAIGFLFSEGVISSVDSVRSATELSEEIICVMLDHDLENDFQEKKAYTSGCAKGSLSLKSLAGYGIKPVESDCRYSAGDILSIMKRFGQRSELFMQTGGVHSCAICGKDDIVYFSEDIGRHNSLDKVIGKALLNMLELKDKLLVTTGRISSDIVLKAARAGIPIVASHSAPTDMAIDIAKAAAITMAGFARGNRMNIYSGSERITT